MNRPRRGTPLNEEQNKLLQSGISNSRSVVGNKSATVMKIKSVLNSFYSKYNLNMENLENNIKLLNTLDSNQALEQEFEIHCAKYSSEDNKHVFFIRGALFYTPETRTSNIFKDPSKFYCPECKELLGYQQKIMDNCKFLIDQNIIIMNQSQSAKFKDNVRSLNKFYDVYNNTCEFTHECGCIGAFPLVILYKNIIQEKIGTLDSYGIPQCRCMVNGKVRKSIRSSLDSISSNWCAALTIQKINYHVSQFDSMGTSKFRDEYSFQETLDCGCLQTFTGNGLISNFYQTVKCVCFSKIKNQIINNVKSLIEDGKMELVDETYEEFKNYIINSEVISILSQTKRFKLPCGHIVDGATIGSTFWKGLSNFFLNYKCSACHPIKAIQKVLDGIDNYICPALGIDKDSKNAIDAKEYVKVNVSDTGDAFTIKDQRDHVFTFNTTRFLITDGNLDIPLCQDCLEYDKVIGKVDILFQNLYKEDSNQYVNNFSKAKSIINNSKDPYSVVIDYTIESCSCVQRFVTGFLFTGECCDLNKCPNHEAKNDLIQEPNHFNNFGRIKRLVGKCSHLVKQDDWCQYCASGAIKGEVYTRDAINKVVSLIDPTSSKILLSSKNHYKDTLGKVNESPSKSKTSEDNVKVYYDDFHLQWKEDEILLEDNKYLYIEELNCVNGYENGIIIEADGPEHFEHSSRSKYDKDKNLFYTRQKLRFKSIFRISTTYIELVDIEFRDEFIADLILIAINDMVINTERNHWYLSNEVYTRSYELDESEKNITILSKSITWKGQRPFKDWLINGNEKCIQRLRYTTSLLNQNYNIDFKNYFIHSDKSEFVEPLKFSKKYHFNGIEHFQLFFIDYEKEKSLIAIINHNQKKYVFITTKYKPTINYIKACLDFCNIDAKYFSFFQNINSNSNKIYIQLTKYINFSSSIITTSLGKINNFITAYQVSLYINKDNNNNSNNNNNSENDNDNNNDNNDNNNIKL